MSVTNAATLSAFDADAALRAAKETVDGPLYSFCEFTVEDFQPLYVDDRTLSMYESVDHMVEHFQRIHTHVHMDFMEINLLTRQLFPNAERVEYLTTAMDVLKLLRVYVDDDGLFIALDPDEPVEPIVAAIKQVVARSGVNRP